MLLLLITAVSRLKEYQMNSLCGIIIGTKCRLSGIFTGFIDEFADNNFSLISFFIGIFR